MALIRDYDLAGGITVTNAYFVIGTLASSKILLEPVPDTDPVEMQPSDKWNAHFTVAVFKDKATRMASGQPLAIVSDATPPPLFSTTFIFDPVISALPAEQAYAHLMAQPYFENATVDIDS